MLIRKIIRAAMLVWSISFVILIAVFGLSGTGISIEMLVFLPLFAGPVALIWYRERMGGIIVFIVSLSLIFIFDWEFDEIENPGLIAFIVPLICGLASYLNSRRMPGAARELEGQGE